MFKKLRTVIYHVNDIAAAKDWYIKATGIQPYFDEPFYVGFDINGFELGLDPGNPNVISGNHTLSYWAVDDVDTTSNKLVDLGGTMVQPKTNVGGDIYVATVEDPFGNHIGMIQGA
jgi:predicted enzyme related to lactoylglutathione lyase